MLKLELLFLVMSGFVRAGECGFDENPVSTNPTPKFISTATKGSYSIQTLIVDAEKLRFIKPIYDSLSSNTNIVPKVVGVGKNPDSIFCEIHLENVFKIDVLESLNTKDIIKTYNALIDGLNKYGYRFKFTLSRNAFMFNPSTQSFHFVHFEGLFSKQILDQGQTLNDYAKEYFDNWIFKHKIPILKSDGLQKYSKGENSKKLFYFEEYKRRYGEDLFEEKINFDDKIMFKKEGDETDKLKIEISTANGSTMITATLGKQKKFFDLKKDVYSFMIYLCQRDGSGLTICRNLKETDNNNSLVWEYDVERKLKIDIEVQDGQSEYRSNEKSIDTPFLKIHFTLTPEDTPGVIAEDQFLFKEDLVNRFKDHVILCETNYSNLRGAEHQHDSVRFKSTKMIKNSPINKTNSKIYQIAPGVYPYKAEACFGTNKKLFIIEKSKADDILLINKQNEDAPVYLAFVMKQPGINQAIISTCKQTLENKYAFYYIHPENTSQDVNIIHKYPGDMFIMLNKNSEKNIRDICVYHGEPESPYLVNYELENLEIEITEKTYFNYNFNSLIFSSDLQKLSMSYYYFDKLENSKSLIYFTQNENEKIVDFKFKEFELPKNLLEWIFISVSETSTGQYRVRAMFFFNEIEIREIITSNNKEIFLSKIPSKIIDNMINSENKNKFSEHFLPNLNANYLSNSEIVYSIKKDISKDCYPIIEQLKNNNTQEESVFLICSKKEVKLPKTVISKMINISTSLSPGLERILNNYSSSKKWVI